MSCVVAVVVVTAAAAAVVLVVLVVSSYIICFADFLCTAGSYITASAYTCLPVPSG